VLGVTVTAPTIPTAPEDMVAVTKPFTEDTPIDEPEATETLKVPLEGVTETTPTIALWNTPVP